MVKTLMQSVIAPAEGGLQPERRRRWADWRADYERPEGQQRAYSESPDEAQSVSRSDGRSTLDSELQFATADDPTASPGVQVERIAQFLRVGSLATADGLLQSLSIFESILRQRSPLSMPNPTLVQYIEAVVTQSRKLLADLVEVDVGIA